ncbi:bacillithiol biosynthesis deacetylase BshB1 [Chitinophagales bacterium]|nr:bacillithiol biosynthesis deacetylase BshB1 [Chitinophagales bacterium]
MIDLLAIGVHPDDIELGCAGTLLAEKHRGKSIAAVDLTRGELGTRGTPELRLKESTAAAKILGLSYRSNLEMPDGWFENNEINRRKLIREIRHLRPKIILANAIEDRHPDHGRAATLIYDACFLAGLRKIETTWEDGEIQEPHRPDLLLHYTQDRWIKPDIVVDISGFMDLKLESIKAYGSQFFDPNSDEENTYISSPQFWENIKTRGMEVGRAMGYSYGEGFTTNRMLGVQSLFNLD